MARKAKQQAQDSNSAAQIKSYIERIESLKDDRAAVNEDIKAVFGEAKASGFKPKIIRNVLRIRDADPETFGEDMRQTNLYLTAVGMPEVDMSAVADL